MIHKDNYEWYHHPPSEGEYIPEAIALVGATAGCGWPTVHYSVGESLYLVLQCSHSALQLHQSRRGLPILRYSVQDTSKL